MEYKTGSGLQEPDPVLFQFVKATNISKWLKTNQMSEKQQDAKFYEDKAVK